MCNKGDIKLNTSCVFILDDAQIKKIQQTEKDLALWWAEGELDNLEDYYAKNKI